MKKTIALLLAMAMTLTLCAPSGLSTARAADLSAQAVAEQSDLSAEASAEELSALEQDESDPAPEVEVEQPEAVAEEEQPSAEPEEESQPEPAPEEEVELDEPTAVAEVEAEDEDESPEIAVQAYYYNVGDFKIGDNGLLREYTGSSGNVVIPKKIGNYTVTGIYKDVFKNKRSTITSVEIQADITDIGGTSTIGTGGVAVFTDCTNLKSVTLPNTITAIGAYVFEGCTSLTSVTIPNGVTSIGDNAFKGCKALKSMTLPESVTTICGTAFSYCTSMTSLTISNSSAKFVDMSGRSSFADCSDLTFYGYSSTSTAKTYAEANKFGYVQMSGSTVTKYNNYSSNSAKLVLPSGITSIGASAFAGCTGLTSVTIPSGVTSIGSSAFDDCTGLTSVTIPSGVTSIGQYAFDGCTGLKSVTIPNTVTSIDAWAFRKCTALTSVTIPSSVKSIGGNGGGNAFSECSNLTSVTIEEGVQEVGVSAFQSCSKLTSVTIPKSVNTILSRAFHNCSNLTDLNIENSGVTVSYPAFTSSSRLANIWIPCNATPSSSLSYAVNYAKTNGSTNVTLKNKAHTFGAWSNGQRTCSACQKVETCSHAWGSWNSTTSTRTCNTCGMTQTCSHASWNAWNTSGTTSKRTCKTCGKEQTCSHASWNAWNTSGTTSKRTCKTCGKEQTCTNHTWGSNGDGVNKRCSNCGKVETCSHNWGSWNSTTSQRTCSTCGAEETCSHNWGTGWNSTTSQRTCKTCGKVETCTNHNWSVWSNSQRTCSTCGAEETCTEHKWGDWSDGVSTCETCGSQSKIIVENGVLTKYEGVATALVLPSGITSIGNYAFKECNGLTSVSIPSSVTSIGNYAFVSCTKLSSVTIPSGVMSIGIGAFDSCSALESVSIPSGVTSIGDDAFASCTNLSSVSIPSSVKSIGNYAFVSCTKLSSVSIPSSVTSIGMGAFFNTSLSSVSIPSSVKSIGNYAFSSCRNLSSVELPCNASDTLKSALVSQAGDENKVKVNDHDWGNGWSDSQRTCSTCGKEETCSHTWGSNGDGENKKCSTCGKVETCTNHTWGNWENPYTYENNSRSHTCSTCGKVESCGHNTPEHNDYWSKTSEGHTCTNCGLIGEHEFFDLAGSNYLECGICQWTGMCYHETWDAETKCTRCKVQGYTVTVNSENNDTALQGGGIYAENTKATVIAPAKAGFTFNGWYKGETQVCKTLEYSFWVTERTSLTTTLTAKYEANQEFAVTILGENGAQFTVGDNTTVQTSINGEEYPFGTKLVLKAVDADKVSAWLNGSDKKLGSGATLEVTVTGAMTIKLMYKAEADGQAMVEYVSDYGQILSCKSYSATDEITVPTGPSKTGYTFVKWSLTVDEIKAKIQADEKHIVVTPVYQDIETTYTVTVNYPDGTESDTFENIREGTAKTITAKDIEGKTFAYWKDTNHDCISYSKSYYLVVTENVTLTAVYRTGVSEDEPQAKPLIHMEKSKAFEEDGVAKLSFTTSYDVPAGYTLNEVGIIRSTSANTEDTLVIGGTGVKQHPSSLTTEKGVYTYVIRVGTHVDDTVYARGYVVVTNNATGNIETMYAELAWGSYNSFRGSTNG